MWNAVANACDRVARRGRLWLAIDVKTPDYPKQLALKQRYHRATWLGKKCMVWRRIARLMCQRLGEGRNRFAWNERRCRGMDVYHDILDWLGASPYEVASAKEVVGYCTAGISPAESRDRPSEPHVALRTLALSRDLPEPTGCAA